ncbi:hypothetical protein HI855_05570 [Cyanobacteria bacterium 150NLHA]|uniref:hypothetical protein n=1 Tax=Prochlorococcus TaxID=1218 RepID=UPI0007B3241B|nr:MULTISPECIES: hypothetical protein [Prochlorococcus]NMO83785.1 hypothetical protein [Prochlorococcus sp. P1344]NMP06037.1 hypothetical protein [Prochlorococcus sp. P1361]NMP12432.1 hypothetical protein [Prochlorococcus sp.P1363]
MGFTQPIVLICPLDALTMAATIPMALDGAAVSARVGRDHLGSVAIVMISKLERLSMITITSCW